MDATDVAATVRRVLSKEIASPLASRLASVESATASDPQTVELKLKEPAAPLLSSLATIAIVPSEVETNKDALQRTPNGTGPFKFQEWQPNGYILLARHDGYWQQGLPKLSGVKFNIVPESATRQVGLTNGQYALLPNIDAATALQLKGKPNVKLGETLELAYALVGMNVSKPPFDNPKVREALNYAVNRDEIVQGALFGAGVPGGPLSPALKTWAVDVKEYPCYKHDAAKAQALLKEAGVTTPVAVTMSVLPRQDIKDIAQVVQEQLNKAGFKVELKNQELGQFIQDWRNSNFDLFASTNAGNPDPDEYFYRTFRTGGSTNVFKYSDPEIDRLLDSARASLDQATRKAAYDQVQRKLACTGPIAHLTYGTLFSAARDSLQGYEVMPNRSLVLLRETTLRP
jgi:peptide/nickel transport system substrate-binding protein